jgi:hypothetical protein
MISVADPIAVVSPGAPKDIPLTDLPLTDLPARDLPKELPPTEQPAGTSAPLASHPAASFAVAAGERELRLDLFRGMALWLIFIDHLPPNILTWFTIRNYGFSDATEIFIFISGYTAAFVYGRAMLEHGVVIATARILKRVWQIYVAHVFLFTIFLAEISYVATSFENPLYSEEMGILDFLKIPMPGNCCSCSAPGARWAALSGCREFCHPTSRCGSRWPTSWRRSGSP